MYNEERISYILLVGGLIVVQHSLTRLKKLLAALWGGDPIAGGSNSNKERRSA